MPGWCHDWRVGVNGVAVEATVDKGYLALARTWAAGDVVALELAMPVMLVEANPWVADDAGRVAITRGPVVYCLEGVDHEVDPRLLRLSHDAVLTPRWEPELLGGVVVIDGEARAPDTAPWAGQLYRPAGATPETSIALHAVPYCTWDNRAAGPMVVWLPVA